LADPEAVEAIGSLWASESADETDAERRLAALSTPQGIISAISLYRLAKSFEGVPASSGTAVRAAAPGAAASVAVDAGSSRIAPAASRSNLPPKVAALMSGLSRADMVDRKLGFAKNPRP
jgi:hypothetical protein